MGGRNRLVSKCLMYLMFIVLNVNSIISYRQIGVFRLFRKWKAFSVWRKNVLCKKVANCKKALNENLFIVNPVSCSVYSTIVHILNYQ